MGCWWVTCRTPPRCLPDKFQQFASTLKGGPRETARWSLDCDWKYFQGHQNEKSPAGIPWVSCPMGVPLFSKNERRPLGIGMLAYAYVPIQQNRPMGDRWVSFAPTWALDGEKMAGNVTMNHGPITCLLQSRRLSSKFNSELNLLGGRRVSIHFLLLFTDRCVICGWSAGVPSESHGTPSRICNPIAIKKRRWPKGEQAISKGTTEGLPRVT